MNAETEIQNLIKIALSRRGCVVLRANVGTLYTPEGVRLHAGVVGHSDLYGHRPDGMAFYIEVKTSSGRLSDAQKKFLDAMKASGAIAGVARSPDEAVNLVFGGGK